MDFRQFTMHTGRLTSLIERRLSSLPFPIRPKSLYDPIRHVLGGGGKRVRPLLVVLACEAAGGEARTAMDAAVAVELLHTFTLVHDDVMDHADMRRGRPTVHRRWDENTAILAGDALVAHAYRLLFRTRTSRLSEVNGVFTGAFIEVCEGQAYDKEFGEKASAGMMEYEMMIRKKTGRLIAAAVEIGALIGDASAGRVTALRRYGEHLGRAFQIKDDLLDIVGTPASLGKPVGGDIVEGKKTYLLLRARAHAHGGDRTVLRSLGSQRRVSRLLITRVRKIYERTGVFDEAMAQVMRSTAAAQRALASLPPSRARDSLHWLSSRLLVRAS